MISVATHAVATPAVIECARCAFVIAPADAEFCWFCQGRLCFVCWDAYGHCGHPEADLEGERARMAMMAEGGAP